MKNFGIAPQWRSKEGRNFEQALCIFFPDYFEQPFLPDYFEQPLLCYIAYLQIVDRLTVLLNAQA